VSSASTPNVTRTLTVRKDLGDIGTALSVLPNAQGTQAQTGVSWPQLTSGNAASTGRCDVKVIADLTGTSNVDQIVTWAVAYVAANDVGASLFEAGRFSGYTSSPFYLQLGHAGSGNFTAENKAQVPWPAAGSLKYFRVFFPAATSATWHVDLRVNAATVDTLNTSGEYEESATMTTVAVDDLVDIRVTRTSGSGGFSGLVLLAFVPGE
jgi:hypothetical protein